MAAAAAYVSLVNDWTDRADDRRAGKTNRMEGRSVRQVMLLLAAPLAAALFFGSQLDPKPVTLTNDAYMQQVDRVCEQRMFAEASLTGNASFLQLQQISLQETQAIKNLPPPVTPEAVYGRKVVLKWKRKIDKTAAQIVADARTSNNPRTTLENETPRLIDVMKQAEARMAALGLPHCARP